MKSKHLFFYKISILSFLIASTFEFAKADLADDETKETTQQNISESQNKTKTEPSLDQNIKQEKKLNKNETPTGFDRQDSKSEDQKLSPPEMQKSSQKEALKQEASQTKVLTGSSPYRETKSSKIQKGKKILSGSPVKFRADSMSGNRFQGEVNLKGNVNINQGDLLIRGDEARIEQDPKLGQLIKVSVDGKVYLEKVDETTGKKITASAKSAIYSAQSRNITFKGNASITRGTDRMNGNIINYNLSTGLIKAEKVDGMIQQND